MKSEHDKDLRTAFYVMLTGWSLFHIALAFIIKFEWIIVIIGLELFALGLLAFFGILDKKD